MCGLQCVYSGCARACVVCNVCVCVLFVCTRMCGMQSELQGYRQFGDLAIYVKDPESGIKSTARSKTCYDQDVEKSQADSVAWSKASYDRDIKKSQADTAVCSKANYEKEIKASCTIKRQRYVMLCVFTC